MSFASYTAQSVSVADKRGRAFLRKILADSSNWRARWVAFADAGSDWNLYFRCTVENGVGVPDSDVRVMSNIAIIQPPDSDFGDGPPDRESKPVFCARYKRLYLSDWTTRKVARLALDGWDFRLNVHRGSISSSQLGLGFYVLEASHPKDKHLTVDLDQSLVADGKVLFNGPCSF